MNKIRGFTLLEILIVIIILGILVALAIPQYRKTTENSKAAEAYVNLDSIRKGEWAYYARTGGFIITSALSDLNYLDIDNPNNATNRDFTYEVPLGLASIYPPFCIQAKRNSGPYVNSRILMYANGDIDETYWIGYVGGGGCFLKGTMVTLANGKGKPIDEIKVGDLVLGYDGKQIKPGKITKTFFHPKRKGYLLVTTQDGREIKVTANHRVFTGKGYRRIDTLKVGDNLFVEDGKELKTVKIKSIVSKKEIVDIYNIKVEKLHTYFAQGVLAHNSK